MEVCFNGSFVQEAHPLFNASAAGLLMGDGCFETIRISQGRLPLLPFHLDRLAGSLEQLSMPLSISKDELTEQATDLICRNNCSEGRLRITAFRTNEKPAFLLSTAGIRSDYLSWNDPGYCLGIFPHGRKAVDAYANIKSNSYQLYSLASQWAQNSDLDESLVLNASDEICDGSKTNIFLVNQDVILTPPLSSGCVNGVMRSRVLAYLKEQGFTCREQAITAKDLLIAGEIFLTNALMGIRWVRQFSDRTYQSDKARLLYDQFVSTIFS